MIQVITAHKLKHEHANTVYPIPKNHLPVLIELVKLKNYEAIDLSVSVFQLFTHLYPVCTLHQNIPLYTVYPVMI